MPTGSLPVNLLPATTSLLVGHVGRPLRRQLCIKNEPADELVLTLVHQALRVEVVGELSELCHTRLSL